jgi:aromatic-amino-acid transaminase
MNAPLLPHTALHPVPSPFGALLPQPPDPLLALIKLFHDDPRAEKIDLGVGVYRDEAGNTPVFRAVKAAELKLHATQPTKAYLGPEGDTVFLKLIEKIIFGPGGAGAGSFGVQTPGGTGALRLAAELANAGRPGARIWVGLPSWPIHVPLFAAAGLKIATYNSFDPATQNFCLENMQQALRRASPGDLVLLHGCCHNPTGAGPTLEEWGELAETMVTRGLVPLIDLAYQGLGDGLEQDAAGLRLVAQTCPTLLVAYSCDKNFGLYRERTGAFFVRAGEAAALARSNTLQLARTAWSMPPDHGAAVVRTILEDPALRMSWQDELEKMRLRLLHVRQSLALAVPSLGALRSQQGMFALLPLSGDQIESLRREFGIYMAGSGRINLAGLTDATIPVFAHALQTCGFQDPS